MNFLNRNRVLYPLNTTNRNDNVLRHIPFELCLKYSRIAICYAPFKNEFNFRGSKN